MDEGGREIGGRGRVVRGREKGGGVLAFELITSGRESLKG